MLKSVTAALALLVNFSAAASGQDGPPQPPPNGCPEQCVRVEFNNDVVYACQGGLTNGQGRGCVTADEWDYCEFETTNCSNDDQMVITTPEGDTVLGQECVATRIYQEKTRLRQAKAVALRYYASLTKHSNALD